jgi:hypothetical protein
MNRLQVFPNTDSAHLADKPRTINSPYGANMNVSGTTVAQVTTSTVQSDSADAVSIAVLRKALDLQGSSAAALIQALPQPSLATQGNVGTKVNTFA